MSIKLNGKKLHNESTVVSLGEWIDTINADTLVLHITGTSNNFSIQFEGSLDIVNYYAKSGTKESNPTIFASTTSTINEGWEFDVTSMARFRVNLTAISSGYITVVAVTSN
jgi:hypothetical protein